MTLLISLHDVTEKNVSAAVAAIATLGGVVIGSLPNLRAVFKDLDNDAAESLMFSLRKALLSLGVGFTRIFGESDIATALSSPPYTPGCNEGLGNGKKY